MLGKCATCGLSARRGPASSRARRRASRRYAPSSQTRGQQTSRRMWQFAGSGDWRQFGVPHIVQDRMAWCHAYEAWFSMGEAIPNGQHRILRVDSVGPAVPPRVFSLRRWQFTTSYGRYVESVALVAAYERAQITPIQIASGRDTFGGAHHLRANTDCASRAASASIQTRGNLHNSLVPRIHGEGGKRRHMTR